MNNHHCYRCGVELNSEERQSAREVETVDPLCRPCVLELIHEIRDSIEPALEYVHVDDEGPA